MKNLRWHIIGVLIIIVVVLGVAWFYNGGEHFKGVASVCYGFLLGWLSGAFTAKSVYEKKTGNKIGTPKNLR
jgi:drug/metabolite transporter (DMT)-like permease